MTLYVADYALEVVDDSGAQFIFTPGEPTPLRPSLVPLALARGAREVTGGAEPKAEAKTETKPKA